MKFAKKLSKHAPYAHSIFTCFHHLFTISGNQIVQGHDVLNRVDSFCVLKSPPSTISDA